MSILDAIVSSFREMIDWLGAFIYALMPLVDNGGGSAKYAGIGADGALSDLLPLIGIPIAAAVIFLAIRVVKKISWGY